MGRSQWPREFGRQAAYAGWHAAETADDSPVEVAPVTGETLITAVAIQRDGDVARRHLREIKTRNRRWVCKRFAVVTSQLRHDLDGVWFDDELVMIGREALGDHPGESQLIKVSLREADRERLYGFGRLVGHGGDHGARVDSAREQSAERDLAHEAYAGGLPDQLAKALGRLLQCAGRVRVSVVQFPVPSSAGAVCRDDQRRCGWQLFHVSNRAERMRHVLEGQVAGYRPRVWHARNL